MTLAARLQRLAAPLARVAENPLLGMELRAAFRRRRYVYLLTGLLTVVALALIGAMLLVSHGRSDPSELGRNAFLAFFSVEVAVVALVFPAFSCTSIVEERINKSYDLLVTTRLTAWDIVLGKLMAAVVYGLTFIIATAPLTAITFLYGGVSVGQIVLAYLILFLVGLVVSTYGLLVSSLAESSARAVVRTFLLLPGVLLLVLYPLYAFIGRPLLYGPLAKERADLALRSQLLTLDLVNTGLLWAAVLGWVAAWVSLFVLVATNRVKPPIADRSTPLRSWLFVTWLALLALAFVAAVNNGPFTGGQYQRFLPPFFMLTLGGLTVAAIAFAVAGEEDASSGRLTSVRRFVFGPGAGAGALFVMLLALVTYCALVVVFTVPLDAWRHTGGGNDRAPLTIIRWGAICSLLFLLTVTQIAVLFSRSIGRGTVGRIWVVVVLGFVTAYPMLWYALDGKDKKTATGSLYKGYFLSPITAGISVFRAAPSNDRRLVTFGPTGKQIRELTRSARRVGESRERRASLLDQGIAVHKLSAAFYGLLGWLLLLLNLRHRERAPPVPFRERRILRVDPAPEGLDADSDSDAGPDDDPSDFEPAPPAPPPERRAPPTPTLAAAFPLAGAPPTRATPEPKPKPRLKPPKPATTEVHLADVDELIAPTTRREGVEAEDDDAPLARTSDAQPVPEAEEEAEEESVPESVPVPVPEAEEEAEEESESVPVPVPVPEAEAEAEAKAEPEPEAEPESEAAEQEQEQEREQDSARDSSPSPSSE